MLIPEGSIQSEARVISGRGFVARGDQLTIAIDGSDDAGIAALALLDLMRSQIAWSFENIAGALHELVIAQNPSGVAAVLDTPADQILFLFDQASANLGERRVAANGRSGWTTEVVTAQIVGLRLVDDAAAKPSGHMILRGGLMPGAGADVTMTNVGAPPSFAPPSGANPQFDPVSVPEATPPVSAPPPAASPPPPTAAPPTAAPPPMAAPPTTGSGQPPLSELPPLTTLPPMSAPPTVSDPPVGPDIAPPT